jgi:hypothetical protein
MVTVAAQTLAGTPGQVIQHTIEHWIVDDYFDTGLRVTAWLGGRVQKYHRTVEDYFTTLQRSGFSVEHLRESCPQREHFPDEQTYARRMRIPLFLFLTGRKPIT